MGSGRANECVRTWAYMGVYEAYCPYRPIPYTLNYRMNLRAKER